MMLADAEHDKKIESNVQQCMQKAQEKAQRLKEDLVQHARASNTNSSDAAKLQSTLDRALKNLSSKDAEIASLKAQLGASTPLAMQPKHTMHTPRSQAHALRDLKDLFADPTRRGNDEFESDLDDQLSAMLQLQDELKHAQSGEQAAKQMLEDFEQQRSSQPLAHAFQALNLSRARAQLLQAQEQLVQAHDELRSKNTELSRLRAIAEGSPFKGTGSVEADCDPVPVLSKFGNLTKIFRDKEDALSALKDENSILHEQLQHLSAASDAMMQALNVKETEIARLHEAVREARRGASGEVREAILKKTVGTFIRRWTSQTTAKAMDRWKAEYREARRIRLLELRVVSRWRNLQVVGSYMLWKDHTLEFKRQRYLLAKITKRWKSRVLALGWFAFERTVKDGFNARQEDANLALSVRNSQFEKATCELMKMKLGVSSEVAKRRQQAQLLSVCSSWRNYCQRKKRDWRACNLLLPSVLDRVVYEMVFDWRSSDELLPIDVRKAHTLKSHLKSDSM